MTQDFSLLKALYCIHAPSGKEKKIKKFIANYVKDLGVEVSYDHSGNMYIVKGVADTYPCVVAHLDQVQDEHAKDFVAVETEDIIFGYSPNKRERQGLGADDKNGIWIALKCLEKYDVMKVAFFVGEEVGCVGSSRADMGFFEDCRFVIEPDRRGHDDLITSISGRTCSEKFEKDCGAIAYGYKPNNGLMTDIKELSENGLGLSCINLSCGYYEPHTNNEFTVKEDLVNCLKFVEHIIETMTDVYAFEYVSDWKGLRGYSYYNDVYVPPFEDYGDLETWLDEVIYMNYGLTGEDIYPYISSVLTEHGIDKKAFFDWYYGVGWEDDDEKVEYLK